jgi:hypothetical protein
MSKSLNKLINSGSKKQKSLEATTGNNGVSAGEREGGEEDGNLKKIFTPIELVQHVFDKNVHRLTEDMVQQKVTNWKMVCEQFRKRLQYIVDPASRTTHSPTKQRKSVNNENQSSDNNETTTATNTETFEGNDDSITQKSMDFDDMMHRKSFAVQLEIDGGKSSVQLEEESIAQRVARMIESENTDSSVKANVSGPRKVNTSGPGGKRSVSFATNVDHDNKNKRVSAFTMLTGKESGTSGDTYDDFEGDGMNSDNFKALAVVKNFHNPFHNNPSHVRHEGDNQQQQLQNQEGSSPLKINKKPQLLEKKHRLVDWRDHGLVYKIVGQTSIYQVPRDPTISDNWMSMFASSKTISASTSNAAITLTDESPTSTKPNTPALTSRPGSRASGFGSRKSSAKAPTFGPLERLRSMSIKGLTLESDPNDAPFSHVLSNPSSRPQTAPKLTELSVAITDNDDDGEDSSKKTESTKKTVRDDIERPVSTSSTKEAPTVSIEVLGKKSYWLESKSLAIQEKLKIMDEVYRKQQEIDRNTEYKDGRIKRIPKKRNTMEARRKVFMEYLQNRIESKFDHLDQDD